MSVVITTVTGIEVVGDGYDLVYLDDDLVATGDGNFDYTEGFADGLKAVLPADTTTNVIHLNTEEEVYPWYSQLEKSSLKGFMEAVKLNPSINVS